MLSPLRSGVGMLDPLPLPRPFSPMATLWNQTIDGNHYEVRSAGASIRLYRNGVHHSQWNPDRPLCGSVWDLLALPALHRPVGEVERVLVLGFGAGAVARQLRELVAPTTVVGVEMDPVHLTIADGLGRPQHE